MSVCATSVLLAPGNLMNASTSEFDSVAKWIPISFEPFRCFMIYFALSMWAWLGFALYLASILVMVVMSGLVEIDNQFRLPMSILISFIACFCAVLESFDGGIISTEYPNL